MCRRAELWRNMKNSRVGIWLLLCEFGCSKSCQCLYSLCFYRRVRRKRRSGYSRFHSSALFVCSRTPCAATIPHAIFVVCFHSQRSRTFQCIKQYRTIRCMPLFLPKNAPFCENDIFRPISEQRIVSRQTNRLVLEQPCRLLQTKKSFFVQIRAESKFIRKCVKPPEREAILVYFYIRIKKVETNLVLQLHYLCECIFSVGFEKCQSEK